jgi:hypothetical protein
LVEPGRKKPPRITIIPTTRSAMEDFNIPEEIQVIFASGKNY